MSSSIEDAPSSVFSPLVSSYIRVKREILSIIENKTISADIFRGRPSSWMIVGSGTFHRTPTETPFLPDGPPLKKSTLSEGPPLRKPSPSHNTSGWLKLVDSSKPLREFRPNLSENICVYFCCEGFHCSRSTCPYKHPAGLTQLSKSDQVLLNKYLFENPSSFSLQKPPSKADPAKASTDVSKKKGGAK